MRTSRLAPMVVVVSAALLVPQTASAVKPSYSCPPGFDLGALTLEEGLQLPNIQRGLADGVYDVETLTAGFDSVDRNDDGLVCFKSNPPNANAASLLQYYYNIVENKASVPSG